MRAWLILLTACGAHIGGHGDDDDDAAADARASDALASDAPTTTTPAAPLMRWDFDQHLTNSGTLAGYAMQVPAGANWVTGQSGAAIYFGGNQYGGVDGLRAVLGSRTKLTIAFWMNQPGTLRSAAFDLLNRSSAPYGGVALGYDFNTSALYWCVATTASSVLGGSCNAPNVGLPNEWHHWIMRYDGATVQLFLDDVLVATKATNNDVLGGMPDTLSLPAPLTGYDNLEIYGDVFDVATQCTHVVGGVRTGTTCTLP